MNLLHIILYLIFSQIIFSQNTQSNNNSFYIDFSFFGNFRSSEGQNSSLTSGDGMSVSLGLNYKNKEYIHRARYMYHDEKQFLGANSPSEEFRSFAYLVGKDLFSGTISSSLFIGIGLNSGKIRTSKISSDLQSSSTTMRIISPSTGQNYLSKEFVTASLPLELMIQVKPFNFVAVDVSYFVDINTTRTLHGILLKIALGKIL